MSFRLVEKEATAATDKLPEDEDNDDADTGTIIELIAEEEVEIVTSGLEEITRVYVNAEYLIVSKLNSFYVTHQIERRLPSFMIVYYAYCSK